MTDIKGNRTRCGPTLTGAVLLLALTLTGCGSNDTGKTKDSGGVDTPTEGVTPGGELTTFSDNFDDDANGWAIPPSPDGSTTFIDGDFVWESKQPETRPTVTAETLGEAYDSGTLEMTNVKVTATVTPKRGEAAMGVYCREVPDTDTDFQWYEFVVSDGYAAIRLGDTAGHLDVLAESNDAALPTGQLATIEGSCTDDVVGRGQLALALNGDQLLQVEVADPLGNGAPGLKAYDAPADQSPERFLIAWHDFTVEPAS